VIAALSMAIVLLLALIAIVAYPRVMGKPRSSLAVATSPPGAVLELDGRAVGSTTSGPLTIEDLEVGQKYKLTARLDGYEPTDEIASPVKGSTSTVTLTLRRRPQW